MIYLIDTRDSGKIRCSDRTSRKCGAVMQVGPKVMKSFIIQWTDITRSTISL